jgi:hypothetical protein
LRTIGRDPGDDIAGIDRRVAGSLARRCAPPQIGHCRLRLVPEPHAHDSGHALRKLDRKQIGLSGRGSAFARALLQSILRH